ncbi:hypothetical protein Nepgr_012626 [Nepenthes gracilis]|uniref:Uncharacterized protein n=1 Tax=Nepenthes gracilis TaxID=150966 RepID=A0AAD3XNI5_NEPGR|nr:hypothetical protein Nepgr_012626 [Nepenthes gracilis]
MPSYCHYDGSRELAKGLYGILQTYHLAIRVLYYVEGFKYEQVSLLSQQEMGVPVFEIWNAIILSSLSR